MDYIEFSNEEWYLKVADSPDSRTLETRAGFNKQFTQKLREKYVIRCKKHRFANRSGEFRNKYCCIVATCFEHLCQHQLVYN